MKHSLVVGGTRGIGREVVRIFSAQGSVVSVIGRHAPSAGDADLPGVRFLEADATDPVSFGAVLRAVLRRGPLDSLVFAHRFRGDGDAWEGEIATTLGATKRIIEAVAPEFRPEGDRSIVLTGSVVSHLVAEEQPVGYHVAKAGLRQMTRYFAVALGSRGIRVNAVSPSVFVKDESREYYRRNPETVDLFRRMTPLGRMGTAAEIAAVIAFLCGPGASYVTGQDIVVDGGVSLQAPPSLARKLAAPPSVERGAS